LNITPQGNVVGLKRYCFDKLLEFWRGLRNEVFGGKPITQNLLLQFNVSLELRSWKGSG